MKLELLELHVKLLLHEVKVSEVVALTVFFRGELLLHELVGRQV